MSQVRCSAAKHAHRPRAATSGFFPADLKESFVFSADGVSDLRDDLLNAEVPCMFDPLLHMGVPGELPDERRAREDVARELCADCSMRATCLEYAMAELPEHGIWAGLDPDEIRTARALAEQKKGASGTAAKHAPEALSPTDQKETSPMMTQPQPPVDGDGRDVPLRARPRRLCPTCRTALAGGPVVFTCTPCRRDFHGSRIPTEWNRGEAA